MSTRLRASHQLRAHSGNFEQRVILSVIWMGNSIPLFRYFTSAVNGLKFFPLEVHATVDGCGIRTISIKKQYQKTTPVILVFEFDEKEIKKKSNK